MSVCMEGGGVIFMEERGLYAPKRMVLYVLNGKRKGNIFVYIEEIVVFVGNWMRIFGCRTVPNVHFSAE